VAALLFVACAALPPLFAAVLATRSVVAEEQAVRAFAQHWGPHYPQLQILIKPRMAHLADLVPLYGIGLATLCLEMVSAPAIWQRRDRLFNVTLSMATLLAWLAVMALFTAGNPIDTCMGNEACPLALTAAQNMLTTAHVLAICGAIVCLPSLLRVQPLKQWE
jgi:hypothetical protein